MNIIDIDFFCDGGTAEVRTDEGNFFVNRRISATEGFCQVYTAYPTDHEARSVKTAQRNEVFNTLAISIEKLPSCKKAIVRLLDDAQKSGMWNNSTNV